MYCPKPTQTGGENLSTGFSSVWLWSLDSQVKATSAAVFSECQGHTYSHSKLLTSADGW